MATSIPVTMIDDDGVETTTPLPAHWVICSSCRGEGKSSAHLGAFSRDEMDEQGPEFLEDYLGGVYDKPCARCDGAGKYLEVARDRCRSTEQRAALRWLDDQAEMAYEDRAIVAAEMRLGGEY